MQRTRVSLFVAGALVVGVLAGGGCGGAVAAPKKFKKYTAKDGAFSCLAPSGWEKEEGARADNMYSWVRFTKGSAKIQVRADVGGSLVSDIAKAGQQGDEGEDRALKAVHDDERHKKMVAEDYSDYKEKPSKKIKTAMGEGRQSEFIASGGIGSTLRGTRSTVLTNQRRIEIICECAESNYKTLRPAFSKVIASVKYGN